MRDATVAALLLVATATALVGALGASLLRDPWARLHYTTPPAFAAPAVAAAVAVDAGPRIVTEKAILLAVLLVLTSPISVQALARATRTVHAADESER